MNDIDRKIAEIEECFSCNGTGKVRANYTDKQGKYVFHKKVCEECRGTGMKAIIASKEKINE